MGTGRRVFRASSFKALLLDCELENLEFDNTALENESLSFELIDKKTLTNNETSLKSVFSLLVNAHYQTRPADLQAILNDDNLSVACLKFQKQIIAVALINKEGHLDIETNTAICEGNLRLKGELLPQSIMANFGLREAGELLFYLLRTVKLVYLI